MNELGKYYKEGEVDFNTITPVYQEAFMGWPWYEVSKCADQLPVQRCTSGLSRTAINEMCTACNLQPTRPAYETDELSERFASLESTRPSRWYLESVNDSLALGALAWLGTPERIADEKYADVPAMQDWMVDTLPNEPMVWLDEVFADKNIRPTGNLANFKDMCRGFVRELGGSGVLAYRTISPAMIRAADVNFATSPLSEAPGRRLFIKIGGIE